MAMLLPRVKLALQIMLKAMPMEVTLNVTKMPSARIMEMQVMEICASKGGESCLVALILLINFCISAMSLLNLTLHYMTLSKMSVFTTL